MTANSGFLKSNKVLPVTSDVGRFHVEWQNVSYFVASHPGGGGGGGGQCFGRTDEVKQILNSQSGGLSSSQFVAILGPSGSGKSTMLNIILGKIKKNYLGDVGIVLDHPKGKVNVAFISQQDHLPDRITLREAMFVASRLKHPKQNDYFHRQNIARIIELMPLEKVLDTPLNKCSGGQRRWISIGLELLSYPNILVLDEPTTGLCSVATKQLVSFLRKLAKDKRHPMAIVATIHQPSLNVFLYFDRAYILTKRGECIFSDRPELLTKHLKKSDQECPTYYNPADYILEIASDEYGGAICQHVVNRNTISRVDPKPHLDKTNLFTLAEAIRSNESRFFYQTYIIFVYLLRGLGRDAFFLYIRFLGSLSIAVMHGFVFQNVGKAHGCFPSVHQLYTIEPTELMADHERQVRDVYANLASIFMCILNFYFMGLTTVVLFFPLELQTINKQCHNGWHTPGPYFVAKALVECLVMVPTAFLFTLIWAITTGQFEEAWRFWFIVGMFVFVQLFGFAQGVIVGAIYSDSPVRSIYIGANSMLPFLLISGFFLPVHHFSRALYPLTFLSYYRFAFEAFLLVLYGYGRCELANLSTMVISNTTETPRWIRLLTLVDANLTDGIDAKDRVQLSTRIVNKYFSRQDATQVSYILDERHLHEEDMYTSLMMLNVLAALTLTIAYVVMAAKIRKS